MYVYGVLIRLMADFYVHNYGMLRLITGTLYDHSLTYTVIISTIGILDGRILAYYVLATCIIGRIIYQKLTKYFTYFHSFRCVCKYTSLSYIPT